MAMAREISLDSPWSLSMTCGGEDDDHDHEAADEQRQMSRLALPEAT